MTRAAFFDVDFTLIHPGPAFQGEGYRAACARHGVEVDAARFDHAVASASSTLHSDGGPYDPAVFVNYTSQIIKAMGGKGTGVRAASEELYNSWSECEHFTLYEEVPDVLADLRGRGLKIGLISNTQRSLATFEKHFGLAGLFDVSLSSAEHGYMKPHPSIFEAALRLVGVPAGEAMMVGDSVPHDIAGALRLGMRGVLVVRSGLSRNCPPGVPVIHSLRELPPLL
jgi:HAD superfamily hydrolase (TIGR01549 family)